MATKNDIFNRYLKEYLKANQDRKGAILDHVTDVTEMHRKACIRRFRVLQRRDSGSRETRGRPTYYTKDVDAALFTIWEAANELYGELLHPLINEYVSILRRDNMWIHSDEATGKLLTISERTTRRRCTGFKLNHYALKVHRLLMD